MAPCWILATLHSGHKAFNVASVASFSLISASCISNSIWSCLFLSNSSFSLYITRIKFIMQNNFLITCSHASFRDIWNPMSNLIQYPFQWSVSNCNFWSIMFFTIWGAIYRFLRLTWGIFYWSAFAWATPSPPCCEVASLLVAPLIARSYERTGLSFTSIIWDI